MKNIHTLTCSNKKILLPIINDLKMEVEITENPYQIPIENLLKMAARINKKRSFLFVSKVLGKHLPIQPKNGLLTGHLLATRYEEIVTGKDSFKKKKLLNHFFHSIDDFEEEPFIKKETSSPVIIGFAETATALGHSFFSAFKHASFFHTTREIINETSSIISFEEEHSHATSHRCYVKAEMLENNRDVILVDDELTTGNTAINIIRDIQIKYPRKVYSIVSILDWRSEENEKKLRELEAELDIKIYVVSLLKGRFKLLHEGVTPLISNEYKENQLLDNGKTKVDFISLQEFTENFLLPYTSLSLSNERNNQSFLKDSGRFGIHTQEDCASWTSIAGAYLEKQRKGKKSLCIGTGEFMYIPMKIASYMGKGIFFQSTTRSPIYPNNEEHYGAKNAWTFLNPEDRDIRHYIYNIDPNEYDEFFVFFERKVEEKNLAEMIEALKSTTVNQIHIVFCTGR